MALANSVINHIIANQRRVRALTAELAALRKRVDGLDATGPTLAAGNYMPGMIATPIFPYITLGANQAQKLGLADVDDVDNDIITIQGLTGISPPAGMLGIAMTLARDIYQDIANEVHHYYASITSLASASARAYYWYKASDGGGPATPYALVTPRCLSSADAGVAYEFSSYAYDPVIEHRQTFPNGTRILLWFGNSTPIFNGAAEATHINCTETGG